MVEGVDSTKPTLKIDSSTDSALAQSVAKFIQVQHSTEITPLKKI